MGTREKTILLQAGIWLALAILLVGAFAEDMLFRFAAIRAIGLTILMLIAHYFNRALFNRTIKGGNRKKYFLLLPLLLLAMVLLRLAIESFVFPTQAYPKLMQGDAFRPVFYLFATSLVMAVSTIVLYMIYFFEKENQLLLTINKYNEARLQLLQSQINPHFLFNTLNNIYSLSITNSTKTPGMILELTELLRYSVYQKPKEKVSVSEEAKQVGFLIELFCLRSDESYSISFNKIISGGMIEPMVLIPLAENCLKHCDFDLNPNAFVSMELFSNQKTIRFKTENSYSLSQQKSKTGGVGLNNIRERLKLIYGEKFQFSTAETDGIFKMNLEITWNK